VPSAYFLIAQRSTGSSVGIAVMVLPDTNAVSNHCSFQCGGEAASYMSEDRTRTNSAASRCIGIFQAFGHWLLISRCDRHAQPSWHVFRTQSSAVRIVSRQIAREWAARFSRYQTPTAHARTSPAIMFRRGRATSSKRRLSNMRPFFSRRVPFNRSIRAC